ncbi:hypothetical protein BH24BAC1_BH24BAC1_10290 [soil metagenome]
MCYHMYTSVQYSKPDLLTYVYFIEVIVQLF